MNDIKEENENWERLSQSLRDLALLIIECLAIHINGQGYIYPRDDDEANVCDFLLRLGYLKYNLKKNCYTISE